MCLLFFAALARREYGEKRRENERTKQSASQNDPAEESVAPFFILVTSIQT
jgi:hypothetical protein